MIQSGDLTNRGDPPPVTRTRSVFDLEHLAALEGRIAAARLLEPEGVEDARAWRLGRDAAIRVIAGA